MKTTFFFALLSTALSLVAADIVITPIFEDQIVQKQAGDCFFGVVTPQGCGYALLLLPSPPSPILSEKRLSLVRLMICVKAETRMIRKARCMTTSRPHR
ncbi:hypothetical protein V8C44DRAFT_328206 [Trichoderma aethiopicum]